jgi:NAD(P)-dependent dehydrogenase (short-subunit alcohol dehydrogenase family)
MPEARVDRGRDRRVAYPDAADRDRGRRHVVARQRQRRAADRVRASESRLDVLVDNAGAIHDRRIVTSDRLEATFATMVVGPSVWSRSCSRCSAPGREARVIAVTSGGMYAQSLDLDDLGYERGDFDGTRAYARAKRAQVALVREWARRLGPPSRAGSR